MPTSESGESTVDVIHELGCCKVVCPGAVSSAMELVEQVGKGLTAVVTKVHIREEAAQVLDVEWHKQHEPLLLWERSRPRSLGRRWATIHEVHHARRSLLDAARDWLAARLPGFLLTRSVRSHCLS